MEKRFRIYAREKGKKRFRPMDLKNGVFVGNLIHASILDYNAAHEQYNFMVENNDNFDVELREVTNG